MSKFYGTVEGDVARTSATRTGHRYIKAAAQSYMGSIIVEMGGEAENPQVGIYVVTGSTASASNGSTSIFQGPLKELLA